MKNLLYLGCLISTFNGLYSMSICTNWQQNCAGGGSVNPGFLKILNTTGSCTAAGDYGCDLSYLQHSDINLAPGVKLTDLSGANLTCANFVPNPPSVYDLSGVKFNMSGNVGANLTDACLAGTKLTGAGFQGANLSGADLSYTSAENADFSNAALYNANLSNGDFSNSKFEGAGFQGANLDTTNFTGADLKNLSEGLVTEHAKGVNTNEPMDLRTTQNINTAVFSNADMTGVNLSGMDMQSIGRLDGANLTNANLSNAKNVAGLIINGNKLAGANLANVDFSNQNISGNVDLSNCILAGANLSNTNLGGVNLSNASFYHNKCASGQTCPNIGANINGANFSKANLQGVADLFLTQNFNKAIFNYINGSGLDFGAGCCRENTDPLLNAQGIQLQGANLSNAILDTVDFTGANLQGANLSNANFGYSNLTNANLQNANLTGAQNILTVNGANFAGATLANCGTQNGKKLCPKNANGCCNPE